MSWQKTIGNSHDNALQVSLKRNVGAFGFSLAYTWSQSIDQSSSLADPVDPVDPSVSRGLSAFDLTHNFVANYHYRLPVGQFWRGGPKSLTNGWELFGLTRLTTGFPVTLVNNNDTSLLGTQPNGVNNEGADQLNFTPGPLELKGTPTAGAGFNTSLFSVPVLGDFGGARRRFFHGPGSVEGNVGAANFGQIVSAAAPRLMQVSARLRW